MTPTSSTGSDNRKAVVGDDMNSEEEQSIMVGKKKRKKDANRLKQKKRKQKMKKKGTSKRSKEKNLSSLLRDIALIGTTFAHIHVTIQNRDSQIAPFQVGTECFFFETPLAMSVTKYFFLVAALHLRVLQTIV